MREVKRSRMILPFIIVNQMCDFIIKQKYSMPVVPLLLKKKCHFAQVTVVFILPTIELAFPLIFPSRWPGLLNRLINIVPFQSAVLKERNIGVASDC